MQQKIQAHMEAKRKHAEADSALGDLQVRQHELQKKISVVRGNLTSAEMSVSKALNAADLEKARTGVKTAQQAEEDINVLLKNIEREIGILESRTLPELDRAVVAAEQDVWDVMKRQLLEELRSQHDMQKLLLKAYTAYYNTGMRWPPEQFIKNEIIGYAFNIPAELIQQTSDEMKAQIWPA
jgi:hypothetical protein